MTAAENSPTTTGATGTTTVDGGGNDGLVLSTTETIHSFLAGASSDVELSDDLRELASSLCDHPTVPYKRLRSIWIGSNPSTRPDLMGMLSESNFVFSSPKPREKSEELKARLRKLEEASERKAYDELVKDITPKKVVDEPFSSYKDQMGFGLHVALMMFTGYLVGYYAFRALCSHSPAMSAAGGILGLVGGMLVETLLFIIRTSSQDRKPTRKSTSFTSKQKKNQ
ncbi:uncharacterized protein LOC107762816 isoform X1 [Nicotiana tabacum]|uniref:Uncharacterized protein LOC107762816 isoform X1 n=1 Tax=Nicotiana tabacum TaxID=4097 RepID=A0A1S3XA55_TOBAC|nr:uncharacterized protein LOC104104567 isoform X1 [Nicotiana tomentosiformis]XP_016436694.1 PREDICTED: uncharacterized protein LOC107762816 isoform X1 [Nicotiana tabacum]